MRQHPTPRPFASRAAITLAMSVVMASVLVTPAFAQPSAPAQPPQPQPQPQPQPPAADGQVATIAGVVGRNRIKRVATGRLEAAATDTKLNEGDILTVVAGGRVTLVYSPTGVYQTINAGETVTVTSKAQEADAAANLGKTTAAMVQNLQSNPQGSIAALGGTRERRDPRQPFALSPRNTLIRPGDAVVFSWEAPDVPAKEYRVFLFCEGKELHRGTTNQTSYPLPADVKLDADRLYLWYVTRTDDPRVPSVKPVFKVVGEASWAEIDAQLKANQALANGSDDPAPAFLNSRVLEQHMFYQGAIDGLRAMYAKQPGDAGLIRNLRVTYRKMGFYWEDVDRFVAKLRRQYPEFLPISALAAEQRNGGVIVTFKASNHLQAMSYAVTATAIDAGSAQATAAATATLNHIEGATLSAELKGLKPGKYRIDVKALDDAGAVLPFDVDEPTSTIEVK